VCVCMYVMFYTMIESIDVNYLLIKTLIVKIVTLGD